MSLPAGRHVAPSILSADFSRLGAQVQEVLDVGAKVIHVDVMDGHFVPPITIGPLIVSALADQVHGAGAKLDCHLMIERPENQVAEFAKAGADSISVHVEATEHVHRVVGAIREAGCWAGVAINPGTPVEALSAIAADSDLLLCMSVNPGWGGQSFIETSPAKVEALRRLAPGVAIEIDGGIDPSTAPLAAQAGCDLFVAGSAVFGSDDPGAAFAAISAAIS